MIAKIEVLRALRGAVRRGGVIDCGQGHNAPVDDLQALVAKHRVRQAVDQASAIHGRQHWRRPEQTRDDAMPMIEPGVERLHGDPLIEAMGELVLRLDEGFADAVRRNAGGAVEEAIRRARFLNRDDGDAGVPFVDGRRHSLHHVLPER